jgi:RimJ/RimL family protein N-acetyltransferase
VKLLWGQSDRVETFVAGLVPRLAEGFGPCNAIGIVNDAGELVAGFVYHGWDVPAQTIEFSGASITPKWMTRKVLHALFSYAFDFLGCQMIMTRNSALNKRLHKQLSAYGFTRHDVPRLFGRHEDGVVWFLTDDAFRASKFHLEARHEQTTRANAA